MQRGLTQEDLAQAMKVTRQTIISLEKGKYSPSIHLAFRLSRFFSCTLEELFIYMEDDDE